MKKKVYDPVFGNDEVKIWSTSKQNYDKYLSKTKELYNLLANSDIDIKLSSIDHIEIVRSNIKFYFTSTITEKVCDYYLNSHRFIFINNMVSIT